MNIRLYLDCCKLLSAMMLLTGCLAGIAPAQKDGAQKDGAQKEGLNIVKVEGALEAMSGLQLKIKPESGDAVLVAINPQKTDLDYAGTAEPGFLVPGLMVRFTAAFDASGRPQQSVKELEIFNPARKRRMTAEYMRDQTAGIYPVDAKGGNVEGAKGNQPKNRPNNAPAAGNSMDFRIVGKLTAIQGNTIQVAAGARPIMVQLEKDAKITVVAGDTTFCQPGDKVEVTGLGNAANPEFVQAEKITVTAVKPLALPKPGENVRASRSRRGKKDGDETDTKPKEGVRKERSVSGR